MEIVRQNKSKHNNKGCVACGGPLSLFGPRESYEYHKCQKCGTIQLSPMPNAQALEQAYAEKYATAKQTEEACDPQWWKTAGEPYRIDILNALTKHKVTGTVAEFGAGWGFLSELLIKNGFDCRGVELSAEMASYSQNKGIPIENGGFEVLEHLGTEIHAIVMCAVFEHLTEHKSWLMRFNRRLPIGGKIVSLQPTPTCIRLVADVFRLGNKAKELPELHGAFSPPWHTTFYSLEAMEKLAIEAGFEIVDIQPASQGRVGGAIGFVQQCLQLVNNIGWRLMRSRWPLVTTHVFVMQKVGEPIS